MLGNARAFSGFSVDDIAKAKEFYGETLGVYVTEQNGMLELHTAGDRDTLIYPKARPLSRDVHHLEFRGRRHRHRR